MNLESILRDHYGVTRVYLKKSRISGRYKSATGDEYHINDYFTSAGRKAYSKLICLMYDLESILGGCFSAAAWVMQLHETANIGDFTDIATKTENTCLESIVQSHFGCGKVFLKKRRICGYYTGAGEPEPDYEYFTKAGGKAYERLVRLLGDLGTLFGQGFDDHFMVSCLDQIVTEDY